MRKKFQDYLIISDMDGTFLSSDAKLIKNNIEAIRYFEDNGGTFTVATGRCYRALEIVFPNAPKLINAPGILCNGGYLYDFKNKQCKNALSINKEEMIPLINELLTLFPDAGFRISCEAGFVCPNKTDYLAKRLVPYESITKYETIEDFFNMDWHKVVYCAEEELISNVHRHMRDYRLNDIKITASSPTLLEFIPKNSGKGSKICELRTIYHDKTLIGVGDFDNDLDMLTSVDVAACPDNANEAVKKISSIHLCHHDEGCIADLIYQLDSIKSK